MVVEKRTLSFDPEVWEYIDQKAHAENTTPSALVNEAMRRTARVERGLRAIVEWEHEHGEITDEQLAEVDRVVAEAKAKAERDEPGGVRLR